MPDAVGDYTEVSICNLALAEVGRGGQIASLDEASQSARVCKLRYPYARDAVLRAYDWNFAAKRASLTALPTPPAFEYDKAFDLPPDCLLVRQVYMGEGCPYVIESHQLLANDGGPLNIKYTALVTAPPQFDPLYVAALAARIAADICATLTESSTRSQGLWQVYNLKLQEARKRDAQEGIPDPFPPGSWLTSRYE
jgi:hypothetical protein